MENPHKRNRTLADIGYTHGDGETERAREAACKLWGHVPEPMLSEGNTSMIICERCGKRLA